MTDDRDPDDTPTEEIKASLKRALQEAKGRGRIPLEQMWEGIDLTSKPRIQPRTPDSTQNPGFNPEPRIL
ncbi:MAG: hypothetical protein ACLFT0_20605 [Spirulinaceae cyanobacterium]